MAEERSYLELSQDEGVAHKFYEVTINDTEVTIRYGRIGDKGTSKTTSYADNAKAKAFADKKLREKRRKGYEDAVMGVRKKRAITRRQIDSKPATTKSKAPLVWKFSTGRSAFGVFVDDELCWVGNEAGRIFALNHEGQVQRQFKLPDGVKCLVADDEWRYAGCDDGTVYDISGKAPLAAYDISEDVDIYWLDIRDGVLGVSDAKGFVVMINHEDESHWQKKSDGRSGWMVRCDEIGVYHGHSLGLTMYDWEDGSVVWSHRLPSAVLFGWQEESTIYAACANRIVYQYTKQGHKGHEFKCDAAVFSCAAAEDGKYVFAGDNCSSIYCFDSTGKRLWKMATGCGSAFSMQFHNDRLFVVTTDGSLACYDVSDEAIKGAESGQTFDAKIIAAPAATADVAPTTSVDTVAASAVSSGVVVECYKEGSRLRVRPVGDGFNAGWHVQFPKHLREAGARYVVEALKESSRGGFYRASGDIKKLV
ncbi:MAG: PQQ-binding-like beta-propeller repeat protein [Bradymonadia bacterium]